ncbi:sensor histidine kinase [Pseudobacteriovorax antillogorgiicola]|uniref:histidine kinase n=1 Tax=Pseudobacteriovorax antillogorgiicola TaxID=1513793 RepID=A0A1Y6BPW3_9BACT|nr:HAMP domain-containing sensor histidine kinase [Pseudobacteriovorax antillogorgiicola]TCS55346.1 signal transduction histidine kinase [Pseudobacteriovorax antillogorgiicola]SMF13812.1 Signal transduction histidine kinase [Pseudobacteriovorax antillogorgiicola]
MNLLRIWYSNIKIKDLNEETKLNFIIVLSYIYILMAVPYFITNSQMNLSQVPSIVQLLSGLGTLVSIRLFGSYRTTAHMFMAASLFTVSIVVFVYHHFPYTVLFWGPVLAVVSVYIVGLRWGGFWSVVIVLTLIPILLGDPTSFTVGKELIEGTNFRIVAGVTLAMTMASAYMASYLFQRTISRLSDRLAHSNAVLKEQHQMLEQSMKEKQTLVSIVCHDIASPLMIIAHRAGYAKPENVEETRDSLARIRKASDLIASIIDNVRTFEAVQAGKMELALQPISLINIFQNAEFVFKERLAEKNLKLKYEYENPEDLYVIAEESSLSNSVFNNLISNAIKFSEPGADIVVSAKRVKNSVVLEVRDFGIGMPENIAANLFKSNVKTTRKGTSGESGTGFGMPITRAMMEKYGGKIEVQSKDKQSHPDDHGTKFILSFHGEEDEKKQGKP